MEELVEKWRNVVGWEDYIGDLDEELLALKMEEAARYIMDLPYNQSDNPIKSRSESFVETSIFPIIFRVMKKDIRIGNIESFYSDLILFFNQNRGIHSEYENHPHIDIEAELCALFVEEYVERKRDPIIPRKFVKQWVT